MDKIIGEQLPIYDLPEDAFDHYQRNADDFMFGRHHGKWRKEIAIDFIGVRTSYDELDAKVELAAQALIRYGIKQGDYVTFVMPNLPEMVVYIYACWRIGAIINTADPRTNPEGILARAVNTNSKLMVAVYNVCEEKIDPILDRLPCKNVILVSPSDSLKGSLKLKPLLGGLIFDLKKKAFAKSHNMDAAGGSKYIWHSDFVHDVLYDMPDYRAAYRPGMVAAVLYTSGTSADGLMKGVVLTHDSLNAASVGLYYCVRPQDRCRQDTFGGFIPFFAAYGLVNGMHAALCGGMRVLLVPLFNPDKFAEMLLKLKPNSFLGVPRFHEQLLAHPKLQGKSKRLAFVKNPVSGGDKISLASIERINELYARNGCKTGLRVGYGSTELGASIAVMPTYDPNNTDFPWREQGNVGYLLPHCNAIVIDPETGEVLPFGQDGELCMNSHCQMEEYFGMPEQTAEITYTAKDGTKYYRMGDKGHLDENGCFYFIDRYKRSLMLPDGHSVHPSPIENTIMEHKAVQICAVAALPMAGGGAGAIPTAFVVLRKEYKDSSPQEQQALLLDIDKHCLKHLPERDKAMAYRVVDEVPYTLMGKIDFRALEKEEFDPANFFLTSYLYFPELRPA